MLLLKLRRILLVLLILPVWFAGQCTGKTGKEVTIATVSGGAATFGIDISGEPQQIVNQVITAWKEKLEPVFVYNPDLIVLTEACDLPTFKWSREEKFNYFDFRGDQVLDFFRSAAKNNHCYLAFGTYIRKEDGRWYDSVVLVDREGQIAGIYDKNFPTIEEMEEGFVASDQVSLLQCDFGEVASVICFDLNFDELRERYAALSPDILLFSSMYHGSDFVQNYWAYSCRSFWVSSMFNYNVPSEIRDPVGNLLATTTNYTSFAVATINLDYRLVHLGGHTGKLRSLKEKYGDRVNIADPGELAVVLVTSRHPRMSADEMLKEFDIEPLDPMFNRSREGRARQIKSLHPTR